MLRIEGINVYYGNIHALKNLSLEVERGKIVSLIGANGAGKTSTLKTISGLIRPKTGDILFEGESITGEPAQAIVKKGVSQVPEGRRIFANLTVMENLEMGAYLQTDKQAIKNAIERNFQRFLA